jgi:hypothetical protein
VWWYPRYSSTSKRAETEKVAVAQAKGGLKWSLDTNIASAKSVKLGKNTVPCTIASVAAALITLEVLGPKNVSGISGSKAVGGAPGSKTIADAKKSTTSIKKCIVPAVGALAEISSGGTQGSLLDGQAF